ncbi:AAA family ATPase [Fusarium heterosporum]|uniref:AAA family ATPase n=1 Tax=Fusarium heterosporum TaxID=42747 RepID=A0A8H5TAT6_FUSHE|nr:AAA family ATPase [Fusarium heterosporum]
MENTESIVPSDRQGSPKSNQKSSQHGSDATRASEAEPISPATASSEPSDGTPKSSASSKKSHKKNKGKEKDAESALEKGDVECSDSSSAAAAAASDVDEDKASTVASGSKKDTGVRSNTKNKKLTQKKRSGKKTSAEKSTKEKKKGKIKKQSKVVSGSDPDSDSDSDSYSDSDSDNELAPSVSDSSSDNEAENKKNKKSSSKLKSQFKALELQFTQLQQQLAHSNSITSYGASYATPYSFQHHLLTPPPPLDSVSTTARRGRHLPPRGLPKLSELQSSDLDDDTKDRSSGSKKSKNQKTKKPTYKRVDQVWDNNIHNYKLQDTADADTDSQYEDFIFHVRRTFDWEGKYRATVVDIKSKLLRECLQDIMGNVEGLSLVDEIPRISPNVLFLYLQDIRHHLRALRKAKPAGNSKKSQKKNKERLNDKRKHLKVMIKYINHDFKSTKESLYPMLESGLITFDLLWALWKPNTLAYTTTYGSTTEPRVFKVEVAHLHHSVIKGDFYHVGGKYFEFDGKRFGYGNMSVEMEEFQGAKKITSLSCYPLQYHRNEDKLRRDLIERGKKFVSLSGVHYKSYQGIAFMKRKKGAVMKFNIQPSRVMIDPTIFRRINPNYNVSTVKPKDPDILCDDDDSDSDSKGCSECSDSEDGEKVKYVTKVYKDSDGETRMIRLPKHMTEEEPEEVELDRLPSKKGEVAEDGDDDALEFTDEEYLIASPVVLGFAFSEKQWLELAVSGVNDIEWNEKAWDSLVLEADTKELIKALVTSRKYHAANTIDDVIQGKGKGLVTVLHGPPGTGKTLTAEGIGELLQCPLYMASAGELGTDSRFLEVELQKILDICHAWGAILLLDEADVFLEKRNMHEIHRNALVSIFLRQLEYFQGILFLTTNRVETFDEAFQSRIHIALRYENLNSKAKRTIFKMFLDRVRELGKLKVEPLTEDDLITLSKRDLNGREIKNVVGSAQDLAVTKGEALSMRHIRQVLDVHAKFGHDLKGGTGYEDAMRNYF